jgi:hypothetical protein
VDNNSIFFALGFGLIFGILFFIVDIYNEQKTKEINTSLIAGITITYFFVILLPEIETGLAGFAFPLFKFIGILAGFCTIHLTEKYILFRVERESQLKLRIIGQEEEQVQKEERHLGESLINKILGDDIEKTAFIKITEKLYALKEITRIQEICFEEEKKLVEKLSSSTNNDLFKLNKFSSLKEIAKIQKECVKDVKKLQNSINLKLLQQDQEQPLVRILMINIKMLKELRKKEEELIESEQSISNQLIVDLINSHQTKKKISNDKLTLKLGELLNISTMHEMIIERAGKLEINMLFRLAEDVHIGGIQDIRLIEQICALREITKIQEICLVREGNLEKNIFESDIDKLSILQKLSSLQEISKIRSLYIDEEERLRKQFRNTLQVGFHEHLSMEEFIKKMNSYDELREMQKDAIIKERNLEKSLIRGLTGDEQNKLSLLQLTENLSRLQTTSKFQEECTEKEKVLGASVLNIVMERDYDKHSLNEIATKLYAFSHQEELLLIQDRSLKVKIQNHINERLDVLHMYTNFGYHLIIGIILFVLLLQGFVIAGLFFVFAFFKALTSKTSNDVVLFPGIEVNEESNEPLYLKIIMASSALIGVFVGLLLTTIFHISMEFIFFLFSFISGVILYTIIREVLPENESGRPLYFLLGIIVFLILIIAFESFSSIFPNL